MSIILREKLQPLLDAKGLDFLHGENDYGGLRITDNCEREVICLSGVTFDAAILSTEEIEAVSKLFSKFLNSNEDVIKDLKKLKRQLQLAKVPVAGKGSNILYRCSNGSATLVLSDKCTFTYTYCRGTNNCFSISADPVPPNFSFKDLEMLFKQFVKDTTDFRRENEAYYPILNAYQSKLKELCKIRL